MTRKYDLLIFDWDGTLMDSAERIVRCFQAAARECGLAPLADAAIRRTIGLGVKEALARILPHADDDTCAQVARCYREHFLHRDATPTPLFPGVEAGLRDCQRRGYRLAVATGKSRQGLEAAMGVSGLVALFAVSRCADETRSKPDPCMLNEILAHTGVAPERALMIGDTSYDLEMARCAGMDSVAVSYGVHERGDLMRHAPEACFDTFPAFCAWLDQAAG